MKTKSLNHKETEIINNLIAAFAKSGNFDEFMNYKVNSEFSKEELAIRYMFKVALSCKTEEQLADVMKWIKTVLSCKFRKTLRPFFIAEIMHTIRTSANKFVL